ncbi:hypothetical protein PL11201_580074 [Planktothrix sp. PCC 11201]|nr:hypothetical protein PL11201_580074 [Planktothrix sp. PCC 11201]
MIDHTNLFYLKYCSQQLIKPDISGYINWGQPIKNQKNPKAQTTINLPSLM